MTHFVCQELWWVAEVHHPQWSITTAFGCYGCWLNEWHPFLRGWMVCRFINLPPQLTQTQMISVTKLVANWSSRLPKTWLDTLIVSKRIQVRKLKDNNSKRYPILLQNPSPKIMGKKLSIDYCFPKVGKKQDRFFPAGKKLEKQQLMVFPKVFQTWKKLFKKVTKAIDSKWKKLNPWALESKCHPWIAISLPPPHRALLHQGRGRAHRAARGVDRELEGLTRQIPVRPKKNGWVLTWCSNCFLFFAFLWLLMFCFFHNFRFFFHVPYQKITKHMVKANHTTQKNKSTIHHLHHPKERWNLCCPRTKTKTSRKRQELAIGKQLIIVKQYGSQNHCAVSTRITPGAPKKKSGTMLTRYWSHWKQELWFDLSTRPQVQDHWGVVRLQS